MITYIDNRGIHFLERVYYLINIYISIFSIGLLTGSILDFYNYDIFKIIVYSLIIIISIIKRNKDMYYKIVIYLFGFVNYYHLFDVHPSAFIKCLITSAIIIYDFSFIPDYVCERTLFGNKIITIFNLFIIVILQTLLGGFTFYNFLIDSFLMYIFWIVISTKSYYLRIITNDIYYHSKKNSYIDKMSLIMFYYLLCFNTVTLKIG